MSAIPQGYASWGTPLYPQFGNGIYVGNNPGSSNSVPRGNIPGLGEGGGYGGADWTATNTGIILQTDWYNGGYISSIAQQPNNVFRLTGDGGVGYIEGSNIAFSMPFSGTAGVRILPSTNAINVNNINFVSSIQVLSAGRINMQQLVSSIAGYGWADTA